MSLDSSILLIGFLCQCCILPWEISTPRQWNQEGGWKSEHLVGLLQSSRSILYCWTTKKMIGFTLLNPCEQSWTNWLVAPTAIVIKTAFSHVSQNSLELDFPGPSLLTFMCWVWTISPQRWRMLLNSFWASCEPHACTSWSPGDLLQIEVLLLNLSSLHLPLLWKNLLIIWVPYCFQFHHISGLRPVAPSSRWWPLLPKPLHFSLQRSNLCAIKCLVWFKWLNVVKNCAAITWFLHHRRPNTIIMPSF